MDCPLGSPNTPWHRQGGGTDILHLWAAGREQQPAGLLPVHPSTASGLEELWLCIQGLIPENSISNPWICFLRAGIPSVTRGSCSAAPNPTGGQGLSPVPGLGWWRRSSRWHLAQAVLIIRAALTTRTNQRLANHVTDPEKPQQWD